MAAPPVSSWIPPTRGSVLLDMQCYIANLPNATTAVGTTSTGLNIELTFRAARPPVLSRFYVHCPGLEFCRSSPKVVATDADLVLLCVPVDTNSIVTTRGWDYFVYRPCARLLDLLPNPYPRYLDNSATALISRDGGSSYVVAALGIRLPVYNGNLLIGWDFDLHKYDSNSDEWTCTILSVNDLPRDELVPLPDTVDEKLYHETDKTITVGGERGTVAWVDLWRGIFLCDVLEECPVLQDVPLPKPANGNWIHLLQHCNPRSFRDVTINRHKNCIKYIEMERQLPRKLHTSPVSDMEWVQNNNSDRFQTTHYGWKARTWTMPMVMGSSAAWQPDCEVYAKGITINSLDQCPSLLSKLSNTGEMLQELPIAYPIGSMDDDVVYFRSRTRSRCEVFAIDTRKGMLEAVAGLDVQENVFMLTFCTSDICKYLGSGMREAPKRTEKVAVKPTGKERANQLKCIKDMVSRRGVNRSLPTCSMLHGEQKQDANIGI